MSAGIYDVYLYSVLMRENNELVKAMGLEGISKNQASRLAGEINEHVHAFLNLRSR